MATAEDLGKLDLDELEFLHQAVSPDDPNYGMLTEAVRQKRNPALTPERQDKVNKQYEKTKLPEPGLMERANNYVAEPLNKAGKFLGIVPEDSNGTADDSTTLAGIGRNIYKQLHATAAGAINSIPFAGRGMEALGDLEGRYLGSHIMPRPGELSAIEESAPSPTTAKVSGAIASMTGGLGRIASMPYEAGKAIVSKIPGIGRIPGAATVGGATAGGALQGAGDAAIRRVPEQIARDPVEPIDWVHEVGAPAALGGAFAVPGAAKEAAIHVPRERNPKKPTGGEIAKKYAENRRLGREFTPEGEQALQDAIEQRKQAGAKSIEKTKAFQADEKAELAGRGEYQRSELKATKERELGAKRAQHEEGLLKTRRAQEDELGKLDKESEERVAGESIEGERRLRKQFDEGRLASKADLEKVLNEAYAHPDKKLPSKGFFSKLREFVSKQAREDTANPSGEERTGAPATPPSKILDPETGMPATEGTPAVDAVQEKHLGLGKEMLAMEEQLKGYLGEHASVRDYRNAILNFQKKVESGTPLQQYAYAKAISMLRDHLGAIDPTGKVSQANADYRKAATNRERIRGIVYGKAGEKLGEKSPESRFDDPDAEIEIPSITPQEELRGAEFLRKSRSPELSAHVKEIRDYGYGGALDPVQEAMEAREAMKLEAKRKGEDSIKAQKERNASELAGEDARFSNEDNLIREKLSKSQKTLSEMHGQDLEKVESRAGQSVKKGEAELEDFQAGRKANEDSAWPGLTDVAKDIGYGAVGLTIPHHLGSPLTLLHVAKLGQKLAQPLRSRAAYYLPEAGDYEAALAPSLGALMSALDERKGKGTGAGKARDKAKEQALKLKSYLGITE